MKHFTRLLICVTAALIVASCAKDELSKNPEVAVRVNFSAGITTRAHDTSWDAGYAIGLVMLNENGTSVRDNVYNYEYSTASGNGDDFQPSVGTKTIYFPQDGSEVRFRGYYPYNAGLGPDMVIPFSVVDQTPS